MFVSKEYRAFCKNRNIEIEYCTPPRAHTGSGVVKRAMQTLKNIIIANLEDGISLTESVNRASHVMRFTIHTGLKLTPFELHHGRKPRTELTNIVKDGKAYLSNWLELSVSAPNRPKIPIYVGRVADGDITNHIIRARTKTEEKHLAKGLKSPKKKNLVRYPLYFIEKNHYKKSLEGIFQKKNTNRHKRNRKYYKNGNRKNKEPEIYFGTTVSDRKKEQKRTGNEYNR